jgi:hypothetical protein
MIVSTPRLRQRLNAANEMILFAPIIFVGAVPPLVKLFFDEMSVWGSLLAMGVYVAVWFAVIILVTLWRSKVWVNLDTSQLRVGRKITELADIDSAVLAVGSNRRVPSLSLQLRVGGHVRAVIPLRHRSDVLLTDRSQRKLLAELVNRTRIELPHDPHDPGNKFARYNFPGHIDRDTAVDLILRTPEAYEPLPRSF